MAALPGDLFSYFTDPARYVQWMGRQAVLEPVPGGEYRVRMPDGFAAAGSFVAVEAPHRVGSPGDSRMTRQRLGHGDARAEGGGTRLTLRHENLPSAELRHGHDVAWNVHLPRLAIRAAGGDPGPDPHSRT